MTADELADEVCKRIKEQAKYIAQLECEIYELEEKLKKYECHHGVEGGHACKECYEELTIKR